MIVDKLLSQLEGVRQTGDSQWIAKCPAHDDKSPSLAVSERDEGVGIHCFAGCSVYEVVSSVGLELSDLFPSKPYHYKPERRPIPAIDILRCLTDESTYLLVCCSAILRGYQMTEEELDRVSLASDRIYAAMRAGGVR